MSEDFYVYVAGPISGPPSEYLANVSRLGFWSRMAMDKGFAPINPAGDMLEGLALPEPLPKAAYQERSMALLRLLEGRRGCLFVVAKKRLDGTESGGVAREIAEAERLDIPVFYSLGDMLEWRASALAAVTS